MLLSGALASLRWTRLKMKKAARNTNVRLVRRPSQEDHLILPERFAVVRPRSAVTGCVPYFLYFATVTFKLLINSTNNDRDSLMEKPTSLLL
jgi:hypothetical protein